MKALTLVQLCAREINDVGYERVARNAATVVTPNGSDWVTWLNDAQRTVVLVKPDANAVVETMQLAEGTKQALPAAGLKLLDVTRNMGSNGTTIGRAIRGPVAREELDEANPNWHLATAAAAGGVREWLYDDKKNPLVFWVVPPIQPTGTGAVHVEIVLSKNPTDVVDADVATADINLPDVYSTALQLWMLYRNYAMATQSMNHWQRAAHYFSGFFQSLGVKVRADLWLAGAAPAAMPAQGTTGGG